MDVDELMKTIPKQEEIVDIPISIKRIETVRPNSFSFRWGGVATEVKIYFEDVDDLNSKLGDLANKAEKIGENVKFFRDLAKKGLGEE